MRRVDRVDAVAFESAIRLMNALGGSTRTEAIEGLLAEGLTPPLNASTESRPKRMAELMAQLAGAGAPQVQAANSLPELRLSSLPDNCTPDHIVCRSHGGGEEPSNLDYSSVFESRGKTPVRLSETETPQSLLDRFGPFDRPGLEKIREDLFRSFP